jgi:cellulose synthase/poly-beta-1,6-N-acetylglucosamine synthase-like glycosyltransferase
VISIVVPTVGRRSLAVLLAALSAQIEQASIDAEVFVVADRPLPDAGAPVPDGIKVISGRGAGPAAARNLGWRAARHPWVVFLDDDVVPGPDWLRSLLGDLAVPADVGGVQGVLAVPLPAGRRPTDWERTTAALAEGRWLTADMAYRVDALTAVGGFDERFPAAYREDADLAHRVRRAGWRLVRGRRRTIHPVRPESPWVSVRVQRGNADDALLRRLYGARWRADLDLPPGRRGRHVAITAAALLAVLSRRLRPVAAAVWVAGTAEFAWARIAPGPRTPREVATMLVTSVLIPPAAVGHWCLGWWRSRACRTVTR